jgi:glycosyltransferase involved in cell wall biosynthesis
VKKRLVFSSHVALIDGKEWDGIGNVLLETLPSICSEFIFVRHSMDGLLPSEVRQYKKASISKKVNLHVFGKIAPLRYASELINTVLYFSFKEKADVYIGIDPLNAVAGIFLKKLGRVEKSIFYTADYSPTRFSNKLMNSIYHSIDRYCVKHADEVWSVSSKIAELRRNDNLPDEKNIFMPNVPPVEYNGFRKNKHDKYNLIMYGLVGTQLDFEGGIQAVAALKKEIPDISFTIVGNGPEEERLKRLAKRLGVSDKVIFKGRLPLSQTLELASRAGIGLALYTGEWGFNQFGDSTKCREYFNYGLPVISTDTHATVDEIKKNKAGVVVEKSIESYVEAIKSVIENYDGYSAASRKLGRKYEGVHQKELLRLVG